MDRGIHGHGGPLGGAATSGMPLQGWTAHAMSELKRRQQHLQMRQSDHGGPASQQGADVNAQVQVFQDEAARKAGILPQIKQQPTSSTTSSSGSASASTATAAAVAARANSSATAASQPQQAPHRHSLADFHVIRIIGTGSFGRVFLAQHSAGGGVYAIKCLSKAACIRDGQVKHVIDERGMLLRVDHPFVVRLRTTFQDAECLYLVMDYVPGGEFFTLLRDYPKRTGGNMREEHARFYAAQLVLAIGYLHSHGIVYRDLKPENLLLGGDGYVRMTDFGFAKIVAREGKTATMCGTPDYLAPEVILQKGHNHAVDWWSLGCVIYEMLYGWPPFYTGNARQTYEKVLKGEVAYPPHFTDMVKDLIAGLLHPDPTRRYGMRGQGTADLQAHPWFQGLDWNFVLAKRYQPPYKPKIDKLDDSSHFDDYSKLGPLVHPFLVTPEQQRYFAGF